ncbi:MAG TPA: glycosyltransferase family A protein [Nitrososphaera sp.]|jgi:glycosyltransferase involved in cell wall biosynthesis
MHPPLERKISSGNACIPKISIGMPVYNGALFIRKALNSLLTQTYTDFELIISDNASTDATSEICQEYAAKDKRIQYIRHPVNRGQLLNYQFVLEQARAEYFMWAAADDMWAPDCLSQWAQILDTDDTVALVFSNFNVFYHVSDILEKHYVAPSIHDSVENRLLSRMLNPAAPLIYGMFRRTAATKLKIKSIDYFDVYFGYYMAAQGKVAVCWDYLFFSGMKSKKRQPYSIMDDRIQIAPFFIETIRLINQVISRKHRFIFYLVMARQCVLIFKQNNLERIRSFLNPSIRFY